MVDAGDVRDVEDVIGDLVERRGRAAEGLEPFQVRVPVRAVVRHLLGAAGADRRSSSAASARAMITCATSSLMNAEKKLIMQTPPLRASVAEHVVGHVARMAAERAAEECVATTGTRVVSMT